MVRRIDEDSERQCGVSFDPGTRNPSTGADDSVPVNISSHALRRDGRTSRVCNGSPIPNNGERGVARLAIERDLESTDPCMADLKCHDGCFSDLHRYLAGGFNHGREIDLVLGQESGIHGLLTLFGVVAGSTAIATRTIRVEPIPEDDSVLGDRNTGFVARLVCGNVGGEEFAPCVVRIIAHIMVGPLRNAVRANGPNIARLSKVIPGKDLFLSTSVSNSSC